MRRCSRMMRFSYPIHDPVIPRPDSWWGIFFTRTVRLRSPILNREFPKFTLILTRLYERFRALAWAPTPREAGQHREIADPYHGDLETTRICARQLQVCICNLIGSLFPDSVPVKQIDSMASQQAGSAGKSRAQPWSVRIAGKLKLLWSRLRTI